MAGITATIDVQTLRVQWLSHSSMASICAYWTISKDQLIRLRDVVPLPKRHDRRLRFKPKRSDYRDPTPAEIRRACRDLQAAWDDRTREERAVTKPRQFSIRPIEMTPEARAAFEAFEVDE